MPVVSTTVIGPVRTTISVHDRRPIIWIRLRVKDRCAVDDRRTIRIRLAIHDRRIVDDRLAISVLLVVAVRIAISWPVWITILAADNRADGSTDCGTAAVPTANPMPDSATN